MVACDRGTPRVIGVPHLLFRSFFADMMLVGAALWDLKSKNIEDVNTRMTMVLFGYSGLFMRFAYMVKPRNWFLFSVHGTNVAAQGVVLFKKWQAANTPQLKPLPAPAGVPSEAAKVTNTEPAKLK
jgi:Mitochondrial pyruvate carriers